MLSEIHVSIEDFGGNVAVMKEIPQRTIERKLSVLQKSEVLHRIEATHTGKWMIAEQMIKE